MSTQFWSSPTWRGVRGSAQLLFKIGFAVVGWRGRGRWVG